MMSLRPFEIIKTGITGNNIVENKIKINEYFFCCPFSIFIFTLMSDDTDRAIAFLKRIAPTSPIIEGVVNDIENNPRSRKRYKQLLEWSKNPDNAPPEEQKSLKALNRLDVDDWHSLLSSKRVECLEGKNTRTEIVSTKVKGPCVIKEIKIIHLNYKGRKIRRGFNEFEFPDDPNPTTSSKIIRDEIHVSHVFEATPNKIIADDELIYALDPEHELWTIERMEAKSDDTVFLNKIYEADACEPRKH